MTTLKDLIKICNIDKVIEYLIECDSTVDIPAHLEVLERLKYINLKQSEYKLIVEDFEDEFKGIKEDCTSVHGCIPNDNETYALEFISWDEWLGMEIFETTLAIQPVDRIVGYALYEMTFVGYDENKIKEFADELYRQIEEISNNDEAKLKEFDIKDYIDDNEGD